VETLDTAKKFPTGYRASARPGFPKGATAPWVFRMDGDGGNIVQLATGGIAPTPGCSSDSREVFYFVEENEMSKASLWSVPLSSGTQRQILPSEATQYYAISADGRLAGWTILDPPKARWNIFDLASGRAVSQIPLDTSDMGSDDASSVRFHRTTAPRSTPFSGMAAGRCCISPWTGRPHTRCSTRRRKSFPTLAGRLQANNWRSCGRSQARMWY